MTDPVARLKAALEGRYAIERELGEGGMATVYLADDLKHERKDCLESSVRTSSVDRPSVATRHRPNRRPPVAGSNPAGPTCTKP